MNLFNAFLFMDCTAEFRKTSILFSAWCSKKNCDIFSKMLRGILQGIVIAYIFWLKIALHQ